MFKCKRATMQQIWSTQQNALNLDIQQIGPCRALVLMVMCIQYQCQKGISHREFDLMLQMQWNGTKGSGDRPPVQKCHHTTNLTHTAKCNKFDPMQWILAGSKLPNAANSLYGDLFSLKHWWRCFPPPFAVFHFIDIGDSGYVASLPLYKS